MTQARRREQRQALVAAYDASGLTMAKWCEINGVRMNQLRYWLRESRESQQNQSWACLNLMDDDSATDPTMLPGTPKCLTPATTTAPEISVRIGSATIEVRSGFDPSLLSEVLRVVVARC
jgi:transposase-like protein